MPYCDKCDKMFATRQSLWKHRKQKHAGKTENTIAHKDGLHETLGDGLVIKSRSSSAPIHKERFVSDIINNVGKTAKDQHSALPKKQETKKNSVLPKALSDLPLKLDLEADSDSESYSEGSDTEDDGFMPDKTEELKAVFRKLYRKVESNTENYKKLVLVLDELQRMNCLTREECIGVKHHIQKKIDPTLLTGLASGLIGGLAEKANSKSGSGLYLGKRGRGVSKIHLVEGGGLYLSPLLHPGKDYDGLWMEDGNQTYGAGLILGEDSPFRNIPLLGWLL